MDKRILLLLILAVVLFVGCTSTQRSGDGELKSFSPEGGGFSILLPGTPVYKTESYTISSYVLVSHIYSLDRGSLGAYLVSYMDYPDEVLKADPQVILNGARDGALANVKGGKLFSDKNISLNGYPGREFTIVVGTQYLYSKIFLANKRYYSVMAAGPGYWQVLESFNFTAPSPGEASSSATQGTGVQAY